MTRDEQEGEIGPARKLALRLIPTGRRSSLFLRCICPALARCCFVHRLSSAQFSADASGLFHQYSAHLECGERLDYWRNVGIRRRDRTRATTVSTAAPIEKPSVSTKV